MNTPSFVKHTPRSGNTKLTAPDTLWMKAYTTEVITASFFRLWDFVVEDAGHISLHVFM